MILCVVRRASPARTNAVQLNYFLCGSQSGFVELSVAILGFVIPRPHTECAHRFTPDFQRLEPRGERHDRATAAYDTRVCCTPLYAGPNVHIGPSLRQPQIPLHLAQRARCEGVNMLILRGRLSLRWMVCANSYFTRIRDSNATAALAACSGFEPSACALQERPESQRDPGSSSSASGSRRMNSLTVRARHAARTPG